jgi:hypothetical protein
MPSLMSPPLSLFPGRVTAHLMMPEAREFYKLERLWLGEEDADEVDQPDSRFV